MAVTSAIVLFLVTWFMVLFIVLPIGLRTQGDEGDTVRGTHESSPANFRVWRVVWRVTWISVIVWGLIVAVILSGIIEVRDFDWMNRMGPRPGEG
ncbi:MAG: DUF1467 family protein [Paracoccaceae bacterium]